MRSFLVGPLGPRVFGLVLLVASAGCAYYNTFYLAKKYYREGAKAQEKSLTDAPTPEAAIKFDLVIRQCNKVLTEYSKSKYVDDASYLLGAALYGKGDYDNAIEKLADFQTKFPKSPFAADARFTEGLSRYRRKEYEIADSIFHDVDVRFPKFPRQWELHYYAGEAQSQVKRYDQAAASYGQALEEADTRHERSDALRRLGDTFMLAERPDTAAVIYARCLKVEDRGKQRLDVALSRADALRDMKRYEEAIDFLRDWNVFAAAEKREGEQGLRLYECMALAGRIPEAMAGYRGLVDKFPRTNIAYEAQFRIGYLYEAQLQDYDAAGREYDKLKSQPQSQFSDLAARRGQSLATLKHYRATMASDTTQARAAAAFMLAELYYFQLEKPESALIEYRRVEAEFPKSAYAAKSAYARLWIAAYDRNDTLGTMALTDTIADRYRGTRYAESALYLWQRWSGRIDERTALLDSLLANPDTSRAGWLEPEAEVELTPPPADSTTAEMRRGYVMSHEDSARVDSLMKLGQERREKLREGGGIR
jgi:TolA-binding protein